MLGNLRSCRDIRVCISLGKHIYEWWEGRKEKAVRARDNGCFLRFRSETQQPQALFTGLSAVYKYDSWHFVVVSGQAIYITCFLTGFLTTTH